MWKIIAVFFYTLITTSNALESNSPLIENKALGAEGPEYVGKEELNYVVSLGVFKDKYYIHVCLAVMITGLNGMTAGKCGHYKYYAEKADLNECKENRTKLHVNTKRPMHSHPDALYTVIRFIDFDKYLFDGNQGENDYQGPDIGVFVVKKRVQHTRPVLNIRMSTIQELSENTVFTLIGMSTIDKRHLGEKMLIKKRIVKASMSSPTKPSQIHAIRLWSFYYEPLEVEDLGAPVYVGDQYVGILVRNTWHATVAIDANLEEHIDRIIASTWIPWINGRQTKGRAKASISNTTARSNVNINNQTTG